MRTRAAWAVAAGVFAGGAGMTLWAGIRPPDTDPSLAAVAAGRLPIGPVRGQEAAPPQLDDGWAVAVPADGGFREGALSRLASEIEAGAYPNTHALLVEHDGRLVFESYFEGTDERWGTPLGRRSIGRDSLHDLRSVSKSVTSAVLGIALERSAGAGAVDFEAAVSRPLSQYLSDLELEHASDVTLEHVLTMTPGFEWNEMTVPYTDSTNDELRLYRVEDPVAHVVSRPLAHAPGTTWYYSGGTTQVLAGVIRRLTGESVDDFARDALFAPLGITEYEWLGEPSWRPRQPAAMSALRLRARDLAKIGSVFLHRGRWHGAQIVPEAWVDRSMERHVDRAGAWSDGIWGYGYQWWHARFPDGLEAAVARGNGNQRVYVVPDALLVVTILAGEYNVFEGHSERLFQAVMAARED